MFSQRVDTYCNEIDSKKALKYFETGLKLLNSNKQDEAITNFKKALNEDDYFTEAWVVLSEIYAYRYNNSPDIKSEKINFSLYRNCLLKVVETCPQFDDYKVNYTLGLMFFSEDNYQNARKYFQAYLSKGNKNSPEYINAKSKLDYINSYLELIANPVPFEPIPVEGISTRNDEYLPLISPDGSIAFFTHGYMGKNLGSIYNEDYIEEFTWAERVKNNNKDEIYESRRPMPKPFNRGQNQGAASITIDNSTLYITICEFVSRDYSNCDIYSSQRQGSEWSELVNLGPNINGVRTWESQPSISADGNTLYFSSIRPGNIGWNENNPTSDIYYSIRDENGVWGKAVNMGPIINTAGNEKSPFIHSDSQTLYFSSDGHPGVGGYDIFYSKFRDDNWEKPKNIGYPINTKDDDIGFIVSTDGKKAYFSSNKFKGKGGWDVYSMNLHEAARPEKVMFVKGKLSDETGQALPDARIEIKNLKTKEITKGMVDSITGHYAVAVTINQEKRDDSFLMVVKKEDYSFTSFYIEAAEDIEDVFDESLLVNFEVKPIEVGQAVKINDINFEFASAKLNPESLLVLESFVEFLEDNPHIKFELRGHTDDVGSDITNMRLSNERAKSVYQYLLNLGVPASRMSYKGYGKNMPLVPNTTEANRAINRRTEFYINAK